MGGIKWSIYSLYYETMHRLTKHKNRIVAKFNYKLNLCTMDLVALALPCGLVPLTLGLVALPYGLVPLPQVRTSKAPQLQEGVALLGHLRHGDAADHVRVLLDRLLPDLGKPKPPIDLD